MSFNGEQRMKRLGFDRYLACLILAVAFLLAACGALPLSSSKALGSAQAPTVTREAGAASSYKVLHSFFSGRCDGIWPYAGLIAVHGTLYGTTWDGGRWNVGMLFSITTSGAEQTLYSFPKKSRLGGHFGYEPAAPLIDVNGALYGTTQYGGTPGTRGYGTVFRFDIGAADAKTTEGSAGPRCRRAGKNYLIHAFANGSDGANPVAGLLNVNGTLYGTTPIGGYGSGTVFSVTPSGTEHVLHSFAGGSDGSTPEASLIDVKGALYGTTYGGGTYGGGTVFSISTSGSEQVLHSFGSSSDGSQPVANLVDVNGTLYGTTSRGGSNGAGTVFSISTSGSEQVLHNFGRGSDGRYPLSGLIDVNGALYGTTELGGYFPCYSNHCGTVFSVSTGGKEIVLHSFRGALYSDGEYPYGSLVALHGTLYGTTYAGGASPSEGTVFSLRP